MYNAYRVEVKHNPRPVMIDQREKAATAAARELLMMGFSNIAVEVDGIRVELTPNGTNNAHLGANTQADFDMTFIDIYRLLPAIKRRIMTTSIRYGKEWKLRIDTTDCSIHIIHGSMKDMATFMFRGRNHSQLWLSPGMNDVTEINGIDVYSTGTNVPNYSKITPLYISPDTSINDLDWRTIFGPLGNEMKKFFIEELQAVKAGKN